MPITDIVDPIIRCDLIELTCSVPAEPAPPMVGEICISLVVDQPEIVLVENPLKYDTNALILNVSCR